MTTRMTEPAAEYIPFLLTCPKWCVDRGHAEHERELLDDGRVVFGHVRHFGVGVTVSVDEYCDRPGRYIYAGANLDVVEVRRLVTPKDYEEFADAVCAAVTWAAQDFA